MLLLILRTHGYLFVPPARVLDIAPAKAVRNFLHPTMGSRYVATDLFDMHGISLRSDLTRLGFPDDTFDVIVCYHVLEHIPADRTAMAELARVLKPGGIMFMQVPRRPHSPTDEDPSAPPDVRIQRFGQDDHVRMYGDDLEDRLRQSGLNPTTVRPAAGWPQWQVQRFGLQVQEEVWICRPTDGHQRPEDQTAGAWFPKGISVLAQERGAIPFARRALARSRPGRAALHTLRALRRR